MVDTTGNAVEHGTHYPNRIFIGSLPGTANANDLAEFFKEFGTVLEGKVVLDINGNSRRFGFVTFATSDDVQKVLNQRPIFFKGRMVNIGPAVKRVAEFSTNMGYAIQQVSVPSSAPHGTPAPPPPLKNIEYRPEVPSPPISPMASVSWQNVFLDAFQLSQKAMISSVPLPPIPHFPPSPPLYVVSSNGMPMNAACNNLSFSCQNLPLPPTSSMIQRSGPTHLNPPIYMNFHDTAIKCFAN